MTFVSHVVMHWATEASIVRSNMYCRQVKVGEHSGLQGILQKSELSQLERKNIGIPPKLENSNFTLEINQTLENFQ